jgi:hypothetical protein
MQGDDDEMELDIGALLGAQQFNGQRLSLYIPSRAQDGKPINQRLWVEDALALLAKIGGGATATPIHEGIWINSGSSAPMRDDPVIVYCFIKHYNLIYHIRELRDFMHRLGSENFQDAVAFDFDGYFFIINQENYDEWREE